MDTKVTIPYGVTSDAEPPKKYIRTLAGDMETLKKGGIPDLAPLSASTPEPAERLIAPSPIAPAPPASESSVPEPPEAELNQLPNGPTPLETYASDFTDKVKEENASPVTVLAAEQDARKGEIEVPQPAKHSRSAILYTVAGVVLLIAGGVGVYIAYTRHLASIAPIIFAPSVSTPIFVDEREEISGVGQVLLEAIEQSITRPLASGTVRLLYTSSATTTDNSVLSALREPAPDILLRNVNAEGSMAGIVNVSSVQNPFFILSVTSYSDTFSGMLKWEPLMPRDLSELFPPYSAPSVSNATSMTATTTATTATTTTKVATTTPKTASTIVSKITSTAVAGFRDEVVGNHDVRVYRDAAGRSILLYGYWNQTTLIIARNPSAFTEILNRLANSHS